MTASKIEILADTKIVKAGEKIKPSQASLLKILDMKPFTYKISVVKVFYDRVLYEPWIVDIKDEEIKQKFKDATDMLKMLSLGSGFVTKETVGNEISNIFKDLAGLSLAIGFKTKQTESLS